MKKSKNIALIAHDNRKRDLVEWVEFNYQMLLHHHLICTGTTGSLIEKVLEQKMNTDKLDIPARSVTKMKSGPLGGDQQIGALIAEGKVDIMIFFWDPMEPQPHDVDVKALLRISVLYNIPIASNRSSADFIISSSLFNQSYTPIVKDYKSYLTRKVD